MPPLSVRQAAALAGKDRSTILRAIDSGKLSAARDEHGRFRIDPAELERAFGTLHSPVQRTGVAPDAPPPPAPADAARTAALAREVELLREMLARVDRERSQWEEERAFLRSLIERRDAEVKRLTDERARVEQEPVRLSFLARLFRRQ